MATYAACFAESRRIMNSYRGVQARIVRNPIIGLDDSGSSYPAAGDFLLQIKDDRSGRMGAPNAPVAPSWEDIITTWGRWNSNTIASTEHYRRFTQMRGIHWSKTDETDDRGWRIYSVGETRETSTPDPISAYGKVVPPGNLMMIAGGYAGAVNGNAYTCSFWYGEGITPPIALGGDILISGLVGWGNALKISVNTSGVLEIVHEIGGVDQTVSGSFSSAPWATHIYIARNGTTLDVYVNGVAQAGWSVSSSGDLFFSTHPVALFGDGNDETTTYGDIWFDDSYLDPATHINKFYHPTIPPDLGANGETPTGSQPLMHFSAKQTAAAWNAGTNLGSGGAFTPFGTTITDGRVFSPLTGAIPLIPDSSSVYL